MPLPPLPFAERLRQAREHLGLRPSAVAEPLGWKLDRLRDLETYDDDLPTALSIMDVGRLAEVLELDPAVLLASQTEAAAAAERLDPRQIVALLSAHLQSAGVSAETFSDQVGWDVAPLFSLPERLWELTADGLFDVCGGLGINWLRALPPSTRPILG